MSRSGTSTGPYTDVALVAGTSYTNTGLYNGTTYYFVVRARNDAGDSGYSAQVSARPVAPPPPRDDGGCPPLPYHCQ